MAYQVSVFAENKPGKIERITNVLASQNINIRAITINDSVITVLLNFCWIVQRMDVLH
jgi:hypothetical protein